jgi:succinate dehydrogenase / fumarate reductase cytochrome b subunit
MFNYFIGGYFVNKKRPVNLDLTTIHFPITAIISILHRISGVWLFIALPFLLQMVYKSVASLQSFAQLDLNLNDHWYARFLLWTVMAAASYHLVAGIRHMIMDLGVGDNFNTGKKTAWIVIGVSAALMVAEGVWLW